MVLAVAANLYRADAARADVQVGELFTDHMVLQRDMKVPVWG